MKGKDLLEAMSLVDDKYVDEAENKRLKRGMPIGWLSMAACLCILIGGAMFWLQPRAGNDCAPMENAAAGGTLLEDTLSRAEQEPENSAVADDGQTQTYFIGQVLEIYENSCLVAVTDSGSSYITVGTEVFVPTDIEGSPELTAGDHIKVVFDGMVAETYPLQIFTVFSVDKTDSGGNAVSEGQP